MSKEQETRVNEWDAELPRNNRFDDWPLDTRVSISPELKEQLAGTTEIASTLKAKDNS